MPTCPNGHEVDANVAFCRQCGASLTPLAQAADPAAQTTVVPAHPAVTAPPEHPQPAAPSNTAVYVLAGVIALIGLVGIGIALLLGSEGDNTGRPTPTAPSLQTPATGDTPSQSASATPTSAAPPTGGTTCPGTGPGGSTFGTIGPETSCGFAQAVDAAYVDAAGLNAPSGQTSKVSATSPTTGKRYRNIVCTSGHPWVTCVGGKHNTARMFFSHP